MTRPIYRLPFPDPLGAEYAMEIWSGCGCGCAYCDSARHLRTASAPAEPAVLRAGIVEAVHRQLSDLRSREIKEGREHQRLNVMISKWWDPYPPNTDTEPTRQIIKLLKAHGHNVVIVTKNPEAQDFALLDKRDTYCVSLSTADGLNEPHAMRPAERLCRLMDAQEISGCQTAAQVLLLEKAFSLRMAELPVDKIIYLEPRRVPTRGVICNDLFIARSGGRACFA